MVNKTKTKRETVQTAFRLPADLLHRVDQHVKRMERKNRGMAISRSDAARALLYFALDEVEKTDGE